MFPGRETDQSGYGNFTERPDQDLSCWRHGTGRLRPSLRRPRAPLVGDGSLRSWPRPIIAGDASEPSCGPTAASSFPTTTNGSGPSSAAAATRAAHRRPRGQGPLPPRADRREDSGTPVRPDLGLEPARRGAETTSPRLCRERPGAWIEIRQGSISKQASEVSYADLAAQMGTSEGVVKRAV